MMDNPKQISIIVSNGISKFKFKFRNNQLMVSPLLWAELAKPQKNLYAENLLRESAKRLTAI